MATISRVFKATDWKYAFGEIALIFMGITLALLANAWYESQQERIDEHAILNELQITLGEDLESVELAYKTIGMVNDGIETFVNLMVSGETGQDKYAAGMDSFTRFVTIRVRYGPYETLKSKGLDLVSNPKLRAEITSLYEDEIPNLVENSLIDRNLVRDLTLPPILEWSSMNERFEWIPKHDLEDPWKTELTTLGRHRSMTLTRFYLPSFEGAIELMRSVREQIQIEIEADQ
jgi:hypothetical protein